MTTSEEAKDRKPNPADAAVAAISPPQTAVPVTVFEAEPVRAQGISIVGIGASAGGLEAFEQFFRTLPQDSGLGYVLVSHMDPSHASLLTDILQRSTTLPVVQAQDQMAVVADHVYVIPPNRDMALYHGLLQLSEPERPRGQRMPIDTFLTSLAEDQRERAVGIILSGTGSDGTLGLRSILLNGGLTLVQEPTTAKYDGMPSSAIAAGFASQILPVHAMPGAVIAAEHQRVGRVNLPVPLPPQPQSPPLPADGMNRLLMQVRSATGHDFSNYKRSTISRRIERRMAEHDLTDIALYNRYLKETPAEMQVLFKELLINVTSFFRDPEAFTSLQVDILPKLLAGKPNGYVFRVWVAGCASGEEAYSIAIVLRELMNSPPEDHPTFTTLIYATDLDDDAVATARAGRYPLNIAAEVSPARLRRYFIGDESGFQVKKEIRDMVIFAVQNVIKDPPFTKLDLLSCRNLLIYLDTELQNRLIPIFHYALKPDGILVLSPAESIGKHAELFAVENRRWQIYRSNASARDRHLLYDSLDWQATNRSVQDNATPMRLPTNFAELTTRSLLKAYAPPSVLADSLGNILYVYGETGKYLRPSPGQPTLNVVEMAREGLPMELRRAMECAAKQGTATLGHELSVKTNGDFQTISLSVRPIAETTQQGLLLVSFQDVVYQVPAPVAPTHPLHHGSPAEASRIEALESEVAFLREKLQVTAEEQRSTTEELKSGNEELQSINEELQSTNEELETAKEELQSLNEELITVNTERQGKIEQLADMQNDLKNLLDNINVPTIFIDEKLIVRRFTRDATQIYRLIPTDIGRPLDDIRFLLEGDPLLSKAQGVLDTLVPWEGELRSASGTWFLARILPYRTLDNYIGGVVLTFTDISQRIEADAVQVARELAEAIVDSVREPMLVLDDDLRVVSASRSFYQNFRVQSEKTVGRLIYELGNGQWDIPALRELLETILPRHQTFDDFVVDHEFPDIGQRRMLLNARRIIGKRGASRLILLAMQEDRK